MAALLPAATRVLGLRCPLDAALASQALRMHRSHSAGPTCLQRCALTSDLSSEPLSAPTGPVPTVSSPFPSSGRFYTKTHEWFELEGPNVGLVGITQAAQLALGEIVYCRLPSEGDRFDVMETIVTLEALKSVGEVKSPVSGRVVSVNPRLEAEPGLVTHRPLSEGWLVRLEFRGSLPNYLLRRRNIVRSELEPVLADSSGLQAFILERIGEAGSEQALEQLTITGLNSTERSWVHAAANAVGLATASHGTGQARRLVIERPREGDHEAEASTPAKRGGRKSR